MYHFLNSFVFFQINILIDTDIFTLKDKKNTIITKIHLLLN